MELHRTAEELICLERHGEGIALQCDDGNGIEQTCNGMAVRRREPRRRRLALCREATEML